MSNCAAVGVSFAIAGFTGRGWPGAGLSSATRPQLPRARKARAMLRERFMRAGLAARPDLRQLARWARQIYSAPMRSKLFATLLVALAPMAACRQSTPTAPAENQQVPVPQGQPTKGVDLSHKGKPASGATFDDPSGKETSLSKFTGKPLLVNLWATWCAPCVKELPTLDRLAQMHEKDGALRVLAVSQDFGAHASVEAFLKKNRIQKLEAYQDSKSNLSSGLGAEVLPTSILFDAKGREVWRYVGDLDWTGPEASKLLSPSVESQKP